MQVRNNRYFRQKNGALLITPDRTCTRNAGRFKIDKIENKRLIISIQCDMPETSRFNAITQIAIALSCTISTRSNIYYAQ